MSGSLEPGLCKYMPLIYTYMYILALTLTLLYGSSAYGRGNAAA